MEVSTETVQRLMEIGLIAAGHGYFRDAEEIFAGIQAARPESEMPTVGQALVRMSAGRHREAATVLSQALKQNPDSHLAAALLGMALNLAGMAQASQDALEQVIAENGDESAVALAKSLLGQE